MKLVGALASLLAPLAQPVLAALAPETAHRATLAALRLLPAGAAPRDDPRLRVAAFGLNFPNPIGMAAGFDKNAEVADALLGLGFGFTEVGTLTPLPQAGNPRPRLFRLPEAGALVNRLGFNNDGHARALARLVARNRRPGIVGVNIGANKDSADRIADYVAGICAFASVASYFTVNISSPNTPGLRDLQQAALLDSLLARVLDARDACVAASLPRPSVLLKIAPDLTLADLDDVVRVARARGIDGMIVSNTTLARPGVSAHPLAREPGGLSGAPLMPLSTRMLAETFLRVERQFPLVGVGGIASASDALAKLEAGATLLQLYTALVFKGPALLAEIKHGLSRAMQAGGFDSFAPLVGRAAKERARGAL